MSSKTKAYDQRKESIQNMAMELFYQQGYHNTSVQNIINALNISKGTFYHYFESKEDLLDSISIRTSEQVLQWVQPVIDDASLSAIEKLNRMFLVGSTYKLKKKEDLRTLLQVLNDDNNTIMQAKMWRYGLKKSLPLFRAIIRQGVQEGVFNTLYPDQVAHMLPVIGKSISDEFTEIFIKAEYTAADVHELELKYHAFEQSIERILGAPDGSIHLIAPGIIEKFLKK